MPKTISQSERPDFFAKGGTQHMFGKGSTGKAAPGVSGKQSMSGAGEDGEKANRLFEADNYTRGVDYLHGGHGGMFGKGHAGKKVPGISGKATQEG